MASCPSIVQVRRFSRARLSRMLLPTVKETAKQSLVSHQLLLKAGFIRKSSPGIFSYLPFALRVLNKIEAIIDEELQKIDCQKLCLPLLLPSKLWKDTGRWDSTGPEMIKLKDRNGAEFCLGPTHEEEITALVADAISSYKQLPQRLYQMDRKYRDEIRLRFGLMRAREFVMKDLYTFDATHEKALETYELVRSAYDTIFRRIGLEYRVAEADTGNIGGEHSHEYHILSDAGEDSLLSCPECHYTANQERAAFVPRPLTAERSSGNSELADLLSRHSAPAPIVDGVRSGACDVHFLALQADPLACVALIVGRGRQLNNIPILKRWPHATTLPVTRATEIAQLELLVDVTAEQALGGAIKSSVTSAESGDWCVHCYSKAVRKNVPLAVSRGIEVGHTFLLGDQYAKKLNARFVDERGNKKFFEMGCYGIGVSRILAAVAEINHDLRGLIWPAHLSPYIVCITPLQIPASTQQTEELKLAAERLYDRLGSRAEWRGQVVIDDREVSNGFKLSDASLVGYPLMVVLGSSFLKDGLLEVQPRRTQQRLSMTEHDLLNFDCK